MADMDPRVKLKCLLDTYALHVQRAKRQATIDSEYCDREYVQFNRGQQFVLEYVMRDLESLLSLLEDPADD